MDPKALAEVLRIRTQIPEPASPDTESSSNQAKSSSAPYKLYYVHYIDYNKRLDEWVTIDRMRVDKIQPPSSSSNAASSSASVLANLQPNSANLSSHQQNSVSKNNIAKLNNSTHNHSSSSVGSIFLNLHLVCENNMHIFQ